MSLYDYLTIAVIILSNLTVCPGKTFKSSYNFFLSSSVNAANFPKLIPYPLMIKPFVYCCKLAVLRSLYAGIES